jgi:hypothetical protein
MTHPSVLRGQACDALVAEFVDRPFAWGRTDCVSILRKHLVNMGRPERIKGQTSWSTERGAMRALLASGHRKLADAVNSHGFAPITPASCLAGDLLGLPADAPWDVSLSVYLGRGRCMMLARGRVLVGSWDHTPGAFAEVVAWRIEPCPK